MAQSRAFKDQADDKTDADAGPVAWTFESWLVADRESMRKGERTRLDLLVAAALYLSDNPPDTLTVSAVCGAAGVAHGTFYLYFSDRHALVGDLLGRFVDYVQLRMRAAARQGGDPVRGATAAYFDLFSANAGLMKCLVVGIDAFPEAGAAFQRLNHEWARTVVRAALKDGASATLGEAGLMRRAHALGGMVDQYLTALFITRDPWIGALSADRDEVIDTLTTLWKKGMQP